MSCDYEWQVTRPQTAIAYPQAVRIVFDHASIFDSWLAHFSLAMLFYQSYAQSTAEAAHAAAFLATSIISDCSLRLRYFIMAADNYAVRDVARDMLDRHFGGTLPRFTFVDSLYLIVGKEVRFSNAMLRDVLAAVCARATSERAIVAGLLLKWKRTGTS